MKNINLQSILFNIGNKNQFVYHLLYPFQDGALSALLEETRKEIVVYVIERAMHEIQINKICRGLENFYPFNHHDKQKASRVISCMELGQFGILQTIFDDCERSGDRTKYLDNPYCYLVDYLKNKPTNELKTIYDKVSHRNLTLTTALEIIYGNKRNPIKDKDLGKIDFLNFFRSDGINVYSIDIYDSNRFGIHLQHHLKDFLALIQPMLWWQIKSLTIRKNKLSTLPNTLAWLSELQSIDISHNKFTEVPEAIKWCKKLKFLILEDNLIQTLPQWIINYWEKLEIRVDNHVIVSWDEQNYANIKISRYV